MNEVSARSALAFMGFAMLPSFVDGPIRVISILISVAILLFIAFQEVTRRTDSVRSRQRSRGNPFFWLAGAYLLVVFQEVALRGADIDGLLRSLPGGLLVFAGAFVRHRGLSIPISSLRIGLVCYLIAGVIFGLLGDPTNPCRSDKCSPAGVLYKGGFAHENGMGFAAVLAFIALVGLGAKGAHRVHVVKLMALLSLGVAVASGARTALFAAIGAAVSLALVRFFKRHRPAFTSVVPALSAILGVYLIAVADINDFSFRGRRWVVVREALGGVLEPFGNGVTAWADLQGSFLSTTTTHSAYAAVLIHGGLVTVIAFTMFLIRSANIARTTPTLGLLALVYFLSLQGISETIWDPSGAGNRGWVLIAVALALPGATVPGASNSSQRKAGDKGGQRDVEGAITSLSHQQVSERERSRL